MPGYMTIIIVIVYKKIACYSDKIFNTTWDVSKIAIKKKKKAKRFWHNADGDEDAEICEKTG